MLALCLLACKSDAPRQVDVRGVDLDLGVERLDQGLFHPPVEEMSRTALRMQAEHGEAFRLYVEDILQGAPADDPRLPMVLARFASDPDWRAVQASVDDVFGDMERERQAFEMAFRRLKAIFPDSVTPRVVAFNSGYNYGIVPTDSILGIGVEWFIGSDHPVVAMLAPDEFPMYVKQRMVPEMLVPAAVKGWLLVHYTRDIRGADLLTNLVETGKVMALLDALLPDVDPTLKYAFTAQQLRWCEQNEFLIWKEILEQEMLFSTKADHIGRIMNDGPFTNGFPRDSPGHIGEWIGHRMVQAFLKANPKVSLAELMALEDPNMVLKHYKPR